MKDAPLTIPPAGETRRSMWIALLIVALVGLFMGGVCVNDFTQWDDPGTISENPLLNPPTFSGIAWYWNWRNADMNIFIPLTHTAWAGLAALAQMEGGGEGPTLNPYIFHAGSLLAHALATVVVFLLLKQLLERLNAGKAPSGSATSDWAAFAGAILWGLHPIQVEAVAWASGLKDVLCGMFAMIAVWQYVLFVEASERSNQSAKRAHYALAMLAAAAAMLSKPIGMMTPALVGIVDWCILRRPIKKVMIGVGPWLLLSAACAAIARYHQTGEGSGITPLWTRPLLVGDSLTFYLYKLSFPMRLGLDYGRRPDAVMQSWWVWFAWIIPAALALLLWNNRKRHPALAGAGLLFVFGALPMLGLTAFMFQFYSTTADHYLYQSMLGPAIALAWLVATSPHRRIVGWMTGAALLALAARSMDQTRYWADDMTLWQHTVQVNPRSFAGYMSVGNALMRAGMNDEAEAALRKSLSISPNYIKGHDSMADLMLRMNRLDDAAVHIRKFIELTDAFAEGNRIDNTGAHYRLGQILMEMEQYTQAAEEFRTVLRRHPEHAPAARELKRVTEKMNEPVTK